MTNTSNPTIANAPENKPKAAQRKKLLSLFALVLLVLAIGYFAYFWFYLRHYEETDDAYVGGNMVYVNAQVAGTVTAINFDDNQTVQMGDSLVQFDRADAQVALADAQGRLAEAVRQVRQQMDANDEGFASVTLRQAELQRAQGDLQRRNSLAGTDAMSNEEIAHAKLAVQSAQAAVQVAQRQAASRTSSVAGTSLSTHPTVLRARANFIQNYLASLRSDVPAPISGTVTKRNVQVGQRVNAGSQLMAIVPLDTLWVDANFKEVQLRRLQIGQSVTLSSDLYGDGVVYHGKISGVSAGTGGAFSLLPPQNATGNWIKVVQRVPVRVQLDSAELKKNPLRIGLSMRTQVDLDSKPQALSNTSAAALSTTVFDQQLLTATNKADAIIAKETGHNKTLGAQ